MQQTTTNFDGLRGELGASSLVWTDEINELLNSMLKCMVKLISRTKALFLIVSNQLTPNSLVLTSFVRTWIASFRFS